MDLDAPSRLDKWEHGQVRNRGWEFGCNGTVHNSCPYSRVDIPISMSWLEFKVVVDDNQVIYSIATFMNVIVTSRSCRGEFNYSGARAGGIHSAGTSGCSS